MLRKLKAQLVIFGVAAFATSCGNPKADEQSPGDLDVPELESAEGNLFLSEDSYAKSFTGQVAIWSPSITPEEFAPIIPAVRQATAARVMRYGFIYQDILDPQGIQLMRNAATIRQLRIDQMQSRRAGLLDFGKQWFAGNLPEGANEVQANAVFKSYCEAKIWERATHPELIATRYHMRPTPAVLCEGVYEELGYFSNTDLCAASEAGRSYFDCLWFDGVVRTELFQLYYGENEDLLETLSQRETVALLVANISEPGRGPLARMLLQQRPLALRDSDHNIVVRLPRILLPSQPEHIADRSVFDLISDIEQGRLAVVTVGEQNQPVPEINRVITLLSELNSGNWVSEAMLNHPVVAGDHNLEALNSGRIDLLREAMPQLVAPEEATEEGQRIAVLTKEVGDLLAQIQPLLRKVVTPEDPLVCQSENGADNLSCQQQNALLQAVDKIVDPKVSKAFFPNASLKVEKLASDKDAVRFAWRFGNNPVAAPHLVCFDLVNREKIACPESSPEHIHGKSFDKVAIDPESGQIFLEMTIDDPSDFDLALNVTRDSSDPLRPFNEVDPEKFANVRLKITLVPRKLHGLVDILTGNAEVIGEASDGERRYAATLNLMEQDPQVETSFELLLRVIDALQGS